MSSLQAMLSAGVNPLTVKTHQRLQHSHLLEYPMLWYADKLHGDANFPFQLNLAPAHRAKTTSNCCPDHGITALN